MKQKLVKIKNKLAPHATKIAAAVSIVAVAAAVYYRNKFVEADEELAIWEKGEPVEGDSSDWPSITIGPKALKDIRNGATLLYREASWGDRYYSQQSTVGDFSEQANEDFERFKKTGEFDEDSTKVVEY